MVKIEYYYPRIATIYTRMLRKVIAYILLISTHSFYLLGSQSLASSASRIVVVSLLL